MGFGTFHEKCSRISINIFKRLQGWTKQRINNSGSKSHAIVENISNSREYLQLLLKYLKLKTIVLNIQNVHF